ncbi:MAG: glycosyltransferase family 2 protein [Urechidicola sp.]|nr:glycosyltransferase family 2 protein [Urechidicola sp.]
MRELKVSIVMATYNRAHFIEESLHSIQNQTYTNWECIIVDDGGNDNTLDVVIPFLNDKRFIYKQRGKEHIKGLPGSRNYGLSIATGDTIIFFDDDDIVHPDNLKICVYAITNKDVDFCSYIKKSFEGDFSKNEFDLNNNYDVVLNNENALEDMIVGKYSLSSCVVMWRKKCFVNNIFNENLLYAEEWELYQRILSTNVKGARIGKVLYYNRKHINSNTSEFWSENPIRVNSKKEAIRLIIDNLISKNLLSEYLFNYFVGLAIGFRDRKLLKHILEKRKSNFSERLYLQFKFMLFPLWKNYSRIVKNTPF